MTADLARLRELLEKSPVEWLSARIEPQTATSSFYQPYCPWIANGGPRPVTGDKGSVIGIHADDAELICAMKNALPALLTELEQLRAERDGYRALLIECRQWQAEGEFGDPIPKEYWTPDYAAFIGRLNAAIDAAKEGK